MTGGSAPNEGHRLPGAPARGAFWLCVGSIAASIALRALYLAQPWRVDRATFPMFLNDEGALGLMGLYIQKGARPIFYYGGYYLGALDAYLSAASLWMFGDSLTSLRLTPSVLALAQIPLAYVVARRLYGHREGLLAAALVALPSNFVFEWGSKALIGFFLHSAFILLTLHMVLRILERPRRREFAALGFTAGLALWNNLLTLPYLLTYGAALWLWVPLRRKDLAVLVLAGALGVAPLIYGNVVYPLATPRALARKVLFSLTLAKKQPAGAGEERPRSYRSTPLLQILGAQPRKDGKWSAAGTLGAAFLTLGFIGGIRRCHRARSSADAADFRCHLILLTLAVISVGAGVAGVTGQPVARYQLPLFALLSILAAGWVSAAAPRLSVAVVALVVATHAALLASPTPADGRTSRYRIVAALQRSGLRYGYAGGQMFDLVFLSRENIVLVPLGHSRFLSYEPAVARADRIFYLYRTDHESKPAHQVFLEYLTQNNVRYKRMDVGDYHVLYDFEPRAKLSTKAIAAIRNTFLHRKGRQ